MGFYVVQELWSDGTIVVETDEETESEARATAQKMFDDPTREGDSVRIITIDGELVVELTEKGDCCA